MDEIIQGAKYELPSDSVLHEMHLASFSIQVYWMSQVSQQVIILFQEYPPQNTSVEAANNINEASNLFLSSLGLGYLKLGILGGAKLGLLKSASRVA